ncbi:MAG: fumarate hydratase [Candidatus Cloacimonetes bacterium HGW-Cloacimonetes-1]|jgi:fumarate hydratase subunit alpha|nr:MAG: fumarate hydratase [Candidatus Cloacimonetes bacterium HGW-Cloacimonetes-1]
MRVIPAQVVYDRVIEAISQISYFLDPEVYSALATARRTEQSKLSRDVLQALLDNADVASKQQIPLCQDTGTVVVFASFGSDVFVEGSSLEEIINAAVAKSYADNYLRASIVEDPLYERVNTRNNCPAIIHFDQVPGDKISLHIAQKGGGAENMSVLSMLKPGTEEAEIVELVRQTVCGAGGKPCPPLIIGIGIGGNFETCALLAKKALFVPVEQPNRDPQYAELESKILKTVNDSNVGPQGLGGATTALAVHILTAPCHIASLPVAINLQCHSHRHAHIVI